jgi:hypothetical protein
MKQSATRQGVSNNFELKGKKGDKPLLIPGVVMIFASWYAPSLSYIALNVKQFP